MFDSSSSSSSQLGADIALLQEVAARVALAIDPETSGVVAAEVLDGLIGAHHQIEFATCKAIERIDRTGAWQADGSRSITAYVRRAANETNGWASRRVHLGRALADRIPATREAWASADIGMAQAEIISRAVQHLDEELTAEIDRTLAEAAKVLSTKDLSGLAEMIRQQAAPDDAAKRDQQNYERQNLSLSQTMDGQWVLNGRLDAEAGALVQAVIDAYTRKPEPLLGPDFQPLDPTPAGLRRALALVEICHQAAEHSEECAKKGAGGRPTVVITVDKKDLTAGNGVGDLEGGAVLASGAIRRIACDSDVILNVPGTEGQNLDYGRRTRAISPALRLHLASRDGGCVFPACDARPRWCHAHHIITWLTGGETNPKNLILLCHFHHRLVHEGGWSTEGDAYSLAFHPPDGSPPHRAQRQVIREQSGVLLNC